MDYDPVKIFKALSNPSRLEMLKTIYREHKCGQSKDGTEHEEECSCVCDIVRKFNLAPSTISHHLKELSQAGLIHVWREGKLVLIAPNPDAMKAVSEFSGSLLKEFGRA